jgi:anhydro-N-acetylmuramic acid kinase
MLRTIGLMSGTSLDGVDAAWLETDGERVGRVGPRLTLPYDDDFRRALRRILDVAPTLAEDDPSLAEVVSRLTEHHARAVESLGETADLIGFHGQTILHQPALRRTWQIGDAGLLARLTGTPVACDFRLADVAAGGQGAPLAPAYHAALAADLPRPLAVLNIGGVSNVTWLGEHGEIVAFDTGPGNGPLDDWIFRHTGGAFDRDGALARVGRPDEAALAKLLAHPYFSAPPPKSLDRLDFSQTLAASGLAALSVEDGAATLVAFIAGAVAAATLPGRPVQWLVTGGGRRNPAIMEELRKVLADPHPGPRLQGEAEETPSPFGLGLRRADQGLGEGNVLPVETVGWDGDALEAQCFGFLAARVSAGLPLTYPGTTGIAAPLGGGRIVRP